MLSQAISKSAEPSRKPLKDVPFNLRSLEPKQTHKYKWVTLTQKGGKREARDYAVLVISNNLEKDKLLLHDTITLARAYKGTVFERKLKYPRNNLLHPEQITLDIIGGGKSVREMSYENAEMKILDSTGETNTQHCSFEDCILTFNALLRLAPLLPRDIGSDYTFKLYADLFFFVFAGGQFVSPSVLGLKPIKVGKTVGNIDANHEASPAVTIGHKHKNGGERGIRTPGTV